MGRLTLGMFILASTVSTAHQRICYPLSLFFLLDSHLFVMISIRKIGVLGTSTSLHCHVDVAGYGLVFFVTSKVIIYLINN
jgi:hypothetical protein